MQPLVTLVTDDGGPFRSFRREAFIAIHLELRRVQTRVRTALRERGFGSLDYERLFLEQVEQILDLVAHADDYRVEYTPCARTRRSDGPSAVVVSENAKASGHRSTSGTARTSVACGTPRAPTAG